MRGKTKPEGCTLDGSKLIQISPCIAKVLRENPYPSVYALASLCHSLIIVQFLGRIAVYCPRYEHLKTILRASKLRSNFSVCGPKFTKLGKSVQELSLFYNAVFRLTNDDIFLLSEDIIYSSLFTNGSNKINNK